MKQTSFVKEYLNEFKPARISYRCKNEPWLRSAIICILIFTISFPVSILSEMENYRDLIALLSLMIPIILTLFSIILHGTNREKMFYFLPMDDAKRFHKNRTDYLKRVALHMGFFLIGLLFLKLYTYMSLASLILLLLVDFVLSTMLNPKEGRKGKLETIVLAFSSSFIMLSQLVQVTNSKQSLWLLIVNYVLFFGVILPTFIHYQKAIAEQLQGATNFKEDVDESKN